MFRFLSAISSSSANPLRKHLRRIPLATRPRSRLQNPSSSPSSSSIGRSRCFSGESSGRDALSYDVVIVGAGPAGLSAAIRLKQMCREKNTDLSVCVLEKGSEVGAHILSGNVFEPRSLDELIPDWRQEGAPIKVPVSSDKFWLLTKNRALALPSPFDNKGIAKDGSKRETFQPGVELRGHITLLAEGCRGSLSEKIIKNHKLREKGQGQHQTYALGIKEVWEIEEGKHEPGSVLHSIGWPLDLNTYGGSFVYHMDDRQVSIGFVVALNYRNPYLSPYDEFQKFKHHPAIRQLLEGGTVLQYGARTLNEGGFQSIPYPVFPGGAIIGCSAGFINVPKIKGTHTAMKSGVRIWTCTWLGLLCSGTLYIQRKATFNS